MSAIGVYLRPRGGAVVHTVSDLLEEMVDERESRDQSDQHGADGVEGPISQAYTGRNFVLLRKNSVNRP